MIGKKFTDLRNGRVVEVTDRFEDIVILDGSKKIKVNQLLNTDHFDEFIDPKNFFRNESLLNNFAQKIKQIPDDVLKNIKDESLVTENYNQSDNSKIKKVKMKDPMQPILDEPAVLPADPEMERLELMKKYGINNDPIVDAQRQLEKFKSILQDPEEEIQTFEVNREDDIEVDEEENYQDEVMVEVEKEIIKEVEKAPIVSTTKKTEKNDDPIVTMFKNVKRNREFNVTINYENKIPRPDFIEMMEDSYNTSIIEFLADEFTNQILENPNLIRDKIIAEIKKIVYKEEEVVEVEKKSKEIQLDAKIETKIVEKPKRGRRKKEILENDRSTVN
jgi:hypothetical protein